MSQYLQDKKTQVITNLKEILKICRNQYLTVTQIMSHLKMKRTTTAKYCYRLVKSGHLEVKNEKLINGGFDRVLYTTNLENKKPVIVDEKSEQAQWSTELCNVLGITVKPSSIEGRPIKMDKRIKEAEDQSEYMRNNRKSSRTYVGISPIYNG